MRWEKLGFLYNEQDRVDGFCGAAVPQAVQIRESIFRIYYSPRDKRNRSHIFWIDVDIESLEIVEQCVTPALSPGREGCFDDSGTMMSFVMKDGECWRLYYIGWNLGITVPFRNSLGLATSKDGRSFERAYDGPIIDRTKDEPQFAASCWILKEKKYRIWYLSCTEWVEIPGYGMQHHYHIKYAESDDGVTWKRNGLVAIDYNNKDEYAISRPCVIKGKRGYHMWYSHRGDKYRIGYAFSHDGITWERRDSKVGIDVSTSGFDSEMIEYPAVFRYKDNWYMLYNGNNYGLTGFGIARLMEGTL